MKFGYTIVYVDSVEDTLEFYGKAFGFTTRFLHESKDYGELDTGETVLAFASHAVGEANINGVYLKGNMEDRPFGLELAFISDDVPAAFNKAVEAGAKPIKHPEQKPWGQMVGYVRAIDGSLIELCTPVGS